MTRFCPKCGTTAADEDRFCGSCGNTLAAEAGASGGGVAAAEPGPGTASTTPPAVAGPSTSAVPTPTAGADPAEVTQRIEAMYRKVGDYLRAANVKFMENSQDKSYTALYGSAVAVVKVTAAGGDDTWVAFLAPVVSGARLQPDLLEYLVRKNADYAATKFHLNAANEIWIQYSILGSILDANSCKLAVFFTMITADNEDDVIRAKWGGKPAADILLGRAA